MKSMLCYTELMRQGSSVMTELSPAQISNLEEALDTKVMDRTLIILDILRSEHLQEKVRFRSNLPS